MQEMWGNRIFESCNLFGGGSGWGEWGDSKGKETGNDYSNNQWIDHIEIAHFCLLKECLVWYRSDTEHAISDLTQAKKNLNKQTVGNSGAWTEVSSAQSSALDAVQLPALGVYDPQFKFRWKRLAGPGWVGSSLLLRSPAGHLRNVQNNKSVFCMLIRWLVVGVPG